MVDNISNNEEELEKEPDENNEAVVQRIVVDDSGIQESTLINLNKLEEKGIKDPSAFLEGLLDSLNKNEFNDSSIDYIKGFQYGETGKL